MGSYFSCLPRVEKAKSDLDILLPGVGKELRLDPFPPEVRQLLEKRAVRDVVNLIADYCQYPLGKELKQHRGRTVDWSFICYHEFRMAYSPVNIVLQGRIHQSNIDHFLLFLRLAASHRFVSHEVYGVYTQLSFRADEWRYHLQDKQILEIAQLGFEIANELVPRRPISPLEKFYLHLWDIRGDQLKEYVRQVNYRLHSMGWYFRVNPTYHFSRWLDGSFRGNFLVSRLDEKADYPQLFTQVYFAELTEPCPYTPDEFLFYFRQLVVYYHPDTNPETMVPLVHHPDATILTDKDVFG